MKWPIFLSCVWIVLSPHTSEHRRRRRRRTGHRMKMGKLFLHLLLGKVVGDIGRACRQKGAGGWMAGAEVEKV